MGLDTKSDEIYNSHCGAEGVFDENQQASLGSSVGRAAD